MDEQIIMNEEIEVAEELVKTSSGTGWKVLGGLLALGGLAFGGIKLWKKHKAKHGMVTIPCTTNDDSEDECPEE